MGKEEPLLESGWADWMSEISPGLWDIPLWNLAIPGSHDTVTYCLDRQSSVLESEPKMLRVLDTLCPCFVRPCIMKWATTQDDNVSTQLDSGIRFLDLRIAHKTTDPDNVFYFAHGIYSLQTVKEVLTEVVGWLDLHTKEVLIVAFSAFDGIDQDQHEDLIQFLTTTFKYKICPNSVTPTLRACWEQSYQVILSYGDSAAAGHKGLWPKFDYWWANATDPKRVVSYLEEKKKEGRPGGFFAAGLNLTEDVGFVVSHPCQSLKGVTLRSCDSLLKWVQQQHPGAGGTCVNIICADFIGAFSGFTQMVIGLNRRLPQDAALIQH